MNPSEENDTHIEKVAEIGVLNIKTRVRKCYDRKFHIKSIGS
jgi:hypothetical protein